MNTPSGTAVNSTQRATTVAPPPGRAGAATIPTTIQQQVRIASTRATNTAICRLVRRTSGGLVSFPVMGTKCTAAGAAARSHG